MVRPLSQKGASPERGRVFWRGEGGSLASFWPSRSSVCQTLLNILVPAVSGISTKPRLRS
eukprot:1345896-Amphidinium_carterae.1